MAITVGSSLPPAPKSVWESSPENSVVFPTSSKILLVGVPGAFTPPCSSHVPGYIKDYEQFTAKGVNDIFVVSVNDVFCVAAWKKSLEGGADSKVHFCADATGEYIKTLGLDFDASGLLGNTRSQRFVAVVDGGTVQKLFVEGEAPNITVTASSSVLDAL